MRAASTSSAPTKSPKICIDGRHGLRPIKSGRAGYASASAMSVMVVITSAAVKGLHLLAERGLFVRLQGWRQR